MSIPAVNKDDIFLAILAMDTYHRGVNAGLRTAGLGESSDGAGTQIGTATIVTNSQAGFAKGESPEDLLGFYAIHYSWNGKDVYAYRGTDRGFTDFSTTGDIVNGYTLGAGLPNATQALAAAKFFTDGQHVGRISCRSTLAAA